MMISEGDKHGTNWIDEIKKYKKEINPEIKIFSVDLQGYQDP